MKLIICNVAWMRNYEGVPDDDEPKYGGEFIKEQGYGHEVLNFKNQGKYVYGYVQARNGTINIGRIDKRASNNDFIDNVLVVWRAKSKKGSVVVGWYKNARVYRSEQPASKGRIFKYKKKTISPGYHIRALAKDVKRIPHEKRCFRVPVNHKGFGSQTFVSFLQKPNAEVNKFKRQILQYIKRVARGNFSPYKKGHRKPIDQERKWKIEKTAIDKSTEFYTDRGYNVKSVENENVGYDLLATKNKKNLFIEVKGTSVQNIKDVSVGLTPNEYSKSKSSHNKYRICIVPDTFGKPFVYEFKWNKSKQEWFNEHYFVALNIKKMISANIKII